MLRIIGIIAIGFICLFLDPLIREQTMVMPHFILSTFQIITRLGDAIFAIPIALGIFGVTYYKLPKNRIQTLKTLGATVITMLSGAVIINLGKFLIGRARPKLYEEFGAYHFKPFASAGYDYASFPSGHTMTWALLAFSLINLLPKYRHYLTLSAILVALSRIIVGSHYLSDVFFSLILSAIIVFYAHYYTQRLVYDKS